MLFDFVVFGVGMVVVIVSPWWLSSWVGVALDWLLFGDVVICIGCVSMVC